MNNIYFATILALMIGSFLNVVILRIPNGTMFQKSRSECPKCNNQLKWYHNIPILSWLFLKGKCSFCKEPISIQYPIVEFSSAIIGAIVFYKVGSINVQSVFIFLSLITLLAISVIDIKFKQVPDSLNFIALFFASFALIPDFVLTIQALGNIVAFMGGLLLLKYLMEFFLNKELLGEGDLIVAGTMGALLGLSEGITAIFCAAVISIFPSLYLKYKYKDEVPESSIPKESIKKLKLQLDLLEADYSEQMKTITQEKIESFWNQLNINTNKHAIPFVPFLFIGTILVYTFNFNLY